MVQYVVNRFARDERGANALEYALVMILVAFVIVTGAALLGTNLNNLFNSAGTKVGTVVVPNL
jgi:pilus assembly protein Flp/PilA